MTSVIAHGWATVELARAQGELSAREPIGEFEDAVRCSWLGARCRRARVGDSDAEAGTWVVVLEPDTEGRLAAFLARHGEGWAVTWSTDADGSRTARAASRPGPLGPEILIQSQPMSGPFRLLVPTATIGP